MLNDLLFSSKEKRDVAYHILRSEFGSKTARRYSTGPQQIHPMYVEDLKNTTDGLDRGFGNTVYKTYFGNLYGLSWGALV